MEEAVKKSMQRLHSTQNNLSDFLFENILEKPEVNAVVRSTLGEEKYQQMAAAVQECEHASASAHAYIR